MPMAEKCPKYLNILYDCKKWYNMNRDEGPTIYRPYHSTITRNGRSTTETEPG